ncbi:tRNA dihydrouridine(20/20a) synthase DusA [Marinicella meishanensis]|uniref:tRNA dihydrouridine(20/20a) synthase DusA n=1 Tax=Marinicella meishanensis TaxID=2873263 RepID=UPI001CC17721|nr:tRNA dihydrouridine(20/20a) synthase DusA [Marinicella sp. NBU2979]
MNAAIDRRLAVAPMLDWTDRHCRYFHRLISDRVLLYTEMVTCPAILRGDRDKYLGFSPEENPVALQLGGSDPADLAACARIAEDLGYAEINLNVGCPSDRVQKGRFGACLMKEPELVAECFAAMQNAVTIPVTIKSRIGVDDDDAYESFVSFITTVQAAGCDTFIIHARKALLQGLSPKQNRTVPPLKYHYAHDLKAAHPELTVVVNGGIDTVAVAQSHWQQVDGVMVGRAFWNDPWLIREMHEALGFAPMQRDRDAVLTAYVAYCQAMLQQGLSLHWLIRPILGLFHGLPGNKKWKSHLVTEGPRRKDDVSVIAEAREWVKHVS